MINRLKETEIENHKVPLQKLQESIANLQEEIKTNQSLKLQNDKQLDGIRREQLKLNSVNFFILFNKKK